MICMLHVCMYVCLHVCIYVCIYVYVCVCARARACDLYEMIINLHDGMRLFFSMKKGETKKRREPEHC